MVCAEVSRKFNNDERLRIGLEMTNVCNFHCPICPQAYAKQNRENGFMNWDVFERAVAECEQTAQMVGLSFFGEQTLHPDYMEFANRFRERNFTLETNTNLSVVTRDIMQCWIDTEFDLIRFSVDAITPEVFNRARPGPVRSFEGEIVDDEQRICVINEKIEYWLRLPNHRPTRLVFVESPYNRGAEKRRFIEHWQKKLGRYDHILTKRMISYGGKITNVEAACDTDAVHCNVWENRFLMIDWQGNVSPCNLDTNMDLCLGNILSESIEQLYYGTRAEQLRSQTGICREIEPCRLCHDANNWIHNEEYWGFDDYGTY